MSEPHESKDALESAATAFADAIKKAREEHRIKNVVVIFESPFTGEDGDEHSAMSSLQMGHALDNIINTVSMARSMKKSLDEMTSI